MKINRQFALDECLRQLKLTGLAWDATSVNRKFIDCLIEGLCASVERAFMEYTTAVVDPSGSPSVEILERACEMLGRAAIQAQAREACAHAMAFSCQNCDATCCWDCRSALSGVREVKTIANRFCLAPECVLAEREVWGEVRLREV